MWQAVVFSILLVAGLALLCIANARAIKRARRDFDQRFAQFEQRLQKDANEVIDEIPDS